MPAGAVTVARLGAVDRQWDANWPVEVQRLAIADALAVHRLAGTRRVVEDVLDGAGAVYRLVETKAACARSAGCGLRS